MNVSIVVPAYNEEHGLGGVLTQLGTIQAEMSAAGRRLTESELDLILRDRDTKFAPSFDNIFRDIGTQIVSGNMFPVETDSYIITNDKSLSIDAKYSWSAAG